MKYCVQSEIGGRNTKIFDEIWKMPLPDIIITTILQKKI